MTPEAFEDLLGAHRRLKLEIAAVNNRFGGEFASEKGKIDEQMGALRKRLEEIGTRISNEKAAAIASLGKDPLEAVLENMNLPEAVALIPEPIRPVVTVVREDGEPVYLVSPRGSPNYAFLILGGKRHDTRWYASFVLPGDESSRWFSLACCCCQTERYGFEKPDDLSQSDWLKTMAKLYRDLLAAACQKSGANVLFVRKADKWSDRYEALDGVTFVEANQAKKMVAAPKEALDFFSTTSFLANC